ncbi:hypothetical protein PSEUDO8O_120809 [Pseudomonas sp. 8O]|nr:hypothetical protein PSEUDO8O_120809 [Pseudomonas sp. 8O]
MKTIILDTRSTCRLGVYLDGYGKWQGRLDSNQRMPGSKPGALPLGDAPIFCVERLLTRFPMPPEGGYGRGGWIRTNACQDQNLVPYRLATPLYRITEC